jgi:hypothetical protein
MTNYAHQFAIAFENKLNALEKNAKNGTIYEVEVESGHRFDRIVMSYTMEYQRSNPNFVRAQRSSHAFVEKATGRLIMCATWKAPAKRGGDLASYIDLSKPAEFLAAVEVADFAGGYLYYRNENISKFTEAVARHEAGLLA